MFNVICLYPIFESVENSTFYILVNIIIAMRQFIFTVCQYNIHFVDILNSSSVHVMPL